MLDLYRQTKDLTLIVDQEMTNLENILARLSHDLPVLNIGRELSAFLLSSGEIDRTHATRQWLTNTLRERSPGPIVCTDIDLLFHPSLVLDPLVLFRQISRSTKLIILWPGIYKNDVLSYAQPGHSHYRFWKKPEGIEVKGVNNALQ